MNATSKNRKEQFENLMKELNAPNLDAINLNQILFELKSLADGSENEVERNVIYRRIDEYKEEINISKKQKSITRKFDTIRYLVGTMEFDIRRFLFEYYS